MRYLLDTCVISELVKRRPEARVANWIDGRDERSLFLSVLTFGEIEKGIARLSDEQRRRELRDWVDHELRRRFSGRIMPVDYETASRWGCISGAAERTGHPLPVLDAMLAATALIHGLTLVTRNTADVSTTGVSVVNPWAEHVPGA